MLSLQRCPLVVDAMSQSLRIQMVTPAPARSLHGNRVTAIRWARILRDLGHRVRVSNRWTGTECDLLVALHARRSAQSVARFARLCPGKPLVVALTGTDLYQDLPASLAARKSLELATRLVMLQADGMRYLSASHRRKARVIIQSAPKPARRIRSLKRVMEVAVVAHLRAVKDPFRAALASRRLPAYSRIRVIQVGGPCRKTCEIARNGRFCTTRAISGWGSCLVGKPGSGCNAVGYWWLVLVWKAHPTSLPRRWRPAFPCYLPGFPEWRVCWVTITRDTSRWGIRSGLRK